MKTYFQLFLCRRIKLNLAKIVIIIYSFSFYIADYLDNLNVKIVFCQHTHTQKYMYWLVALSPVDQAIH